MLDWTVALKTAQEWLSKSIPAQLAIAVAAAVLLFGSETMIGIMGLGGIRDTYRPWFGMTLLVVGALLCVEVGAAAAGWVKKRIVWWRNLRGGKRRLHDLTPDERQVLRAYIENDTRTQYLDLQDGVAQGLAQARIIYRASTLGTLTSFAYNMQPWAWDYLRAHPELLD